MDFKKVADHLRRETDPLAVKHIVVVTGEGEFGGNGKLRRKGGQIELEVTLAGDQHLPMIGGIVMREHFWKVGGIIEDGVAFWAVGIPHEHSVSSSAFVVRSAVFEFDRLNLLAIPSGTTLAQALKQAATNGSRAIAAPGKNYATARLADYKLVWREEMTVTIQTNPFLGESSHTERNTLSGTVDKFEYALIQRKEDCEIHVRLKPGAYGQLDEIECFLQAFYRALAFVHARYTWPQWERIDGGAGERLEYATASRGFSDNIHTPLTERTSSNGSDPTALIGKAVECFLREGPFSEKLDNYLFLAREASAAETPVHVGTLGLCAVFEGLVSFLHQSLCAESATTHREEFEGAKAKLIAFVVQQAQSADQHPESALPWKRLEGLVQSAQPMRLVDKYAQLLKHFAIPPQKLQLALEAWNSQRHPLAHGASADGSSMDQLIARSRIAGAINVLAAAAVGFSGLMVLSRIDDDFLRLP